MLHQSPSPTVGVIADAIATVRRDKANDEGGGGNDNHGETEGGRGGGDGEEGVASSPLQPLLPLRLLYHHNDEVGCGLCRPQSIGRLYIAIPYRGWTGFGWWHCSLCLSARECVRFGLQPRLVSLGP